MTSKMATLLLDTPVRLHCLRPHEGHVDPAIFTAANNTRNGSAESNIIGRHYRETLTGDANAKNAYQQIFPPARPRAIMGEMGAVSPMGKMQNTGRVN